MRRIPLRRSKVGQWLTAVGVLLVCLAGIVAYTAFLQLNQEPRVQVLSPGETWHASGAKLTVENLETLTKIPDSPLSQGPGIGGIFVVVTMTAEISDPEGDLVCSGELMATDGRRWRTALSQLRNSGECPMHVTTGPVRFVRLYAIPASAVDHLAGIFVRSYTSQTRVLIRPPA